jgi:hypothetical protein
MLRIPVSKAGRATRLAWLAVFAVPVVALALLAFAKPAPALDRGYAVAFVPSEPELSPPAIQALEEWDEEAESEMEEEEEDFADEDEEEEGEAGGLFPPEECLLRTARSRVLAYPGPGKVKLTVNYTALAPADVAVRLKGKRGPLGLGQANRHFGKHGVLRLAAHLGEAGMKRVLSARSFTVDFDIAAAPSYCQRFYTRRLTIKRSAQNQTAWLQSDSPFGIG